MLVIVLTRSQTLVNMFTIKADTNFLHPIITEFGKLFTETNFYVTREAENVGFWTTKMDSSLVSLYSLKIKPEAFIDFNWDCSDREVCLGINLASFRKVLNPQFGSTVTLTKTKDKESLYVDFEKGKVELLLLELDTVMLDVPIYTEYIEVIMNSKDFALSIQNLQLTEKGNIAIAVDVNAISFTTSGGGFGFCQFKIDKDIKIVRQKEDTMSFENIEYNEEYSANYLLQIASFCRFAEQITIQFPTDNRPMRVEIPLKGDKATLVVHLASRVPEE
jgi:proliferating cell nuclear antigen PCNA